MGVYAARVEAVPAGLSEALAGEGELRLTLVCVRSHGIFARGRERRKWGDRHTAQRRAILVRWALRRELAHLGVGECPQWRLWADPRDCEGGVIDVECVRVVMCPQRGAHSDVSK